MARKSFFKILLTVILFPVALMDAQAAKRYTLQSPDKKTSVQIEAGDNLTYLVNYNKKPIIVASPISMTLADGKVLGRKGLVQKANTRTVRRQVKPLYSTTAEIPEAYNELELQFRGNYSVIFRAYNNGVAYRFATRLGGKITIKDEEATFRFTANHPAFFHPVEKFENSYEQNYLQQPIAAFDSARLTTLPMVVAIPDGLKVGIMEADLFDYAGLYLTLDEQNKFSLKGTLPKKVTAAKVGGHNNFNMVVQSRADYIAETAGTRFFPWRVMTLADSDKDLLHQQLVYLLASESKVADVSWVKPGKVSWDWWSALNLTGVDFKTGFNTQTYKYFIDFAAANGLEYVNLDEGWSDQFDLLKVTTELDLPEVIRYAKEKNVGLILWCVWHTLDKQLIPAMEQFQKWGIAGLKVDFMDRDDQDVVNYYERVAAEAAKRKMLVNFHGAFKPTGIERTYPNIINRESVLGLEYNKFSNKCTPEHDVHIPFIRMMAGPMDYTPGAMFNANKTDFRIINDRPMSQGTRCHQLAMFVAYYAPLQMLADAPTAYEQEPDILNFLKTVPTTWDETRPLDGKIGEYLSLARRKGDTWYIGSMTDWTGRSLKIDLSFLGNGTYTLEYFTDGPNAHRIGNDYKKLTRTVTSKDVLDINLASGGGWAARLTPVK